MVWLARRLWCWVLILMMFLTGMLTADKVMLRQNVIQVHFQGSGADLTANARVYDAICNYMTDGLGDKDLCRELASNISIIEYVGNRALKEQGSSDHLTVTFNAEAFSDQHIGTCRLPEGIYQCLRFKIGDGSAQCRCSVIFTAEEGINELGGLTGWTDIHQKLLSWIGKAEIFLFRGKLFC